MRAILGIDAAWTETNPSGIALAAETGSGWALVAVADSYQRFLARADASLVPEARPRGGMPVAAALLAACERLLDGGRVSLVAIDMPLSHTPIVGRRVSDNLVTRAYVRMGCGTHSPSAARPGALSDTLRAGFGAAGYPLRTNRMETPGIVEVYPHPALIHLTGAAYRLPYKAGKAGQYWPGLGLAERRAEIARQWRRIVSALDDKIAGTAAALPEPPEAARGRALKAYEDRLDAIVCAWIGITAVTGQAEYFGDDESAVWVPRRPEV